MLSQQAAVGRASMCNLVLLHVFHFIARDHDTCMNLHFLLVLSLGQDTKMRHMQSKLLFLVFE